MIDIQTLYAVTPKTQQLVNAIAKHQDPTTLLNGLCGFLAQTFTHAVSIYLYVIDDAQLMLQAQCEHANIKESAPRCLNTNSPSHIVTRCFLAKNQVLMEPSNGLIAYSYWALPIVDEAQATIGVLSLCHQGDVAWDEAYAPDMALVLPLMAQHIACGSPLQPKERFTLPLELRKHVLDVLSDIIFILSEDGFYVDIYGQDSSLLYKEADTLYGRNIKDVIPRELAQQFMNTIKLTVFTQRSQTLKYQLNVLGGAKYFEGRTFFLPFVSCDNKRHIAWVARDITVQHQQQAKIEHLAYYDSLTDIPNRRLLLDRLSQEIAKIKRHHYYSGLVFLDLDRFKFLNDTLGHSYGDLLLQQLAARIKDNIRHEDTFARLGGDEFVLLVPNLGKVEAVAHSKLRHTIEKLQRLLLAPFQLAEHVYTAQVSIGSQLISHAANSCDEVLKNADIAMYQVKHGGRCHQ